MKYCIWPLAILLNASLIVPTLQGAVLSADEQREIVANYLYVTSRLDSRSPLASAVTVEQSDLPIKCGMPAVLAFQTYRHQIDPAILGSMADPRPIMSYTYDTPSGHFKIHYSTTGADAVYRPTLDQNQNGIPDFVDGVAQSADSVYQIIVNTLGFTPPPADDFYPEGGDARYDIFLIDLPSTVYGLTYQDVIVGDSFTSTIVTSFIELDNDYQSITQYKDRPLDAARVTLAHEFFHAVQFGIDFTEFEDDPFRPWWMEMSSTWMEERCYDNINDYYNYLPFFYVEPRASIQQFKNFSDPHAYGAVVWPLYLTQTYGDDIMKAIWNKCGQLGLGPHVLLASEQVIDSISLSTRNLSTSFNEFAVWNFFTGQYAHTAPNDMGFEEKEAYPVLPLDSMARHHEYPLTVVDAQNAFRPQHNGSTYIRFEDVNTIYSDSVFTTFMFGRNLNLPWTVSFVYQLEAFPDSFIVEQYPVENTGSPFWTWANTDTIIAPHNPADHRSVTVIASANTTNYSLYGITKVVEMAYAVLDTSNYRTDLANTPPAVLTPYPNPAVVAQMSDPAMKFRFQVAIDSLGIPDAANADVRIDLFTIAGERIRSINAVFSGEDRLGEHRTGIYTADWDMMNEQGDAVSSGAYLALARLFTDGGSSPLAEKRVKVAVIR